MTQEPQSINAIDTLTRLLASAPPKLSFEASGMAFAPWRQALAAKLRDISGLTRMEAWRCALEPWEGEPEDRGAYTRQRVTIQTTPDYRMPMWVLRPKGPGPFRPLIALHGHGGGMNDVAGVAPQPQDAERIKRINYAYAVQAVEHGYLVFAPNKRGFGERLTGGQDCRALAAAALSLGLSVIGMHTWDNQRLLDYVATRPDARPGPASCIGVSGGGGGTLWLSAMDERIGAAVISGHLAAFDGKGLFGCVCNAAPGLLTWAERADIAGLIAPRPLLIETGSHDDNYSRDRALLALAALRRIYEAAGAADRLDADLFEGGHEWSGRKAWA
ncbi:MAG TPA: alpha/beta hydrolase family protein [Candidatus Brocadiia bacterium]|nr:alpha/beta hydrolase family protein [Candidatus Brocadiia bacterium]